MNGLDGGDFRTSDGIRPGRGRGINAPASDLAFVGRAEFHPDAVPGLELGASGYYGEADQEDDNPALRKNVSVGIRTLDAKYAIREFEVRGEVVAIDISSVHLLGSGTAPVGNRIGAWMLEGAWHAGRWVAPEEGWDLVPFVRVEEFDTNDDVRSGFSRQGTAEREVTTAGVAYFPIPEVAFKLDVEHWRDNAGRAGGGASDDTVERINFGIAWRY